MMTIDLQSLQVQQVSLWIHVPCSSTPDATGELDPHSAQMLCSFMARSSADRVSTFEPTERELDHRHSDQGRDRSARVEGGCAVGT